MWIPEDFVDNDLFEMIRDEGGDQAENLKSEPFTAKRAVISRKVRSISFCPIILSTFWVRFAVETSRLSRPD